MKYPFLNTQQGGIQNSRAPEQPVHTSRMFLRGKMDVKFFLVFIVAENTGSVNIWLWSISCYFSTSLGLLSSCKWILVCTLFCDTMLLTNIKYKQKDWCSTSVMRHWHQFHGGHSWTTGNGRRDKMPGRSQCLLVVYRNLPRMPATQWTSYRNYRSTAIIEFAARNNWNHTNVILKFPALARVIVYSYFLIKAERAALWSWIKVRSSLFIIRAE